MLLLDNPLIFEIWSKVHFKPRFQKLLPYLEGQPKILDVGCASGLLLYYINLEHYTGIDNNEPYITRAKKRHPKATFILGTYPDAFANEKGLFDLILFNGIMHHIETAKKNLCLTACHRLLTDSGKVIIIDHQIDGPRHFLNRVMIWADRGRFLEPRDFYLALLQRDFVIEVIESFGIGPKRYPVWRQLLIMARKKGHE